MTAQVVPETLSDHTCIIIYLFYGAEGRQCFYNGAVCMMQPNAGKWVIREHKSIFSTPMYFHQSYAVNSSGEGSGFTSLVPRLSFSEQEPGNEARLQLHTHVICNGFQAPPD